MDFGFPGSDCVHPHSQPGGKKKEEEGVSETVARHFKKRGRQPKLFLLYQFVRKTVSNFNQSLAEEDVGAEVRESFSH